MANGDTTLSRPGQTNLANSVYALFLKKFAGEVLTTFETEAKLKDLATVRTITGGESAQFPVLGTATAKYHTPGQNIADGANTYLNTIRHAERIIAVDNLMVSATTIAKIDEAMNHYDLRSLYTTELGRALAKKFDTTVAQVICQAARSSPSFTGGGYGFTIADAAFLTSAANLIRGLYKVALRMDMQDVPKEDRYVVLRPAQYYMLTGGGAAGSGGSLLDRDFSDGNGDFAKGIIYKVAGMNIIVSNNIPSSNVAAQTEARNSVHLRGDTLNNSGSGAVGNADLTLGDNGNWWTAVPDTAVDTGATASGYAVNMTNTVALAFHKSAIGTVKLMDIAIESEYRMDLQAHLFVAKYAMGHNVLRPECAYELRSA